MILGENSKRGFLVGVTWALISSLSFSTEGVLGVNTFRGGLDIPTVVAARYTIASVALWLGLLLWARGGRGPALWFGARTLPALLLIGAVGFGGTTTLLFYSFSYIPTSLAILLLYTYPALVSIGAHFLGDEPLTRRSVTALGITFAGLVVVSGVSWGGGNLVGIGLALGAAFVNASQVLLTNRVLKRLPAIPVTAYYLAATAVALWLYSFLTAPVRVVEVTPAATVAVLAERLPLLVALGLVPTLLAILSLLLGIDSIGPSRTSLIGTTEPFFAAVLGAVFLAERLAAGQVMGGLVILVGLAALVWPERYAAGKR